MTRQRGGRETEGRGIGVCCQKLYGKDESGREPKLLPVYQDGLLIEHNSSRPGGLKQGTRTKGLLLQGQDPAPSQHTDTSEWNWA